MRNDSKNAFACGRVSAAMVAAVLSVIVLFAGGCAYYNMLYNAKAKYRDAEAMPTQADGSMSRAKTDAYRQAIEKAQKMIDKYPKSRHVDNAYYLIAQSHFALGEYEETVSTVDTLLAKLPKTDLREHVVFLKGDAYAMWEKYQEALDVLSGFIEEFGGSPYMAQALYLAAKSALLIGDEATSSKYQDHLWKRYRGSEYRLDADIEIAEIYLEKGEYDKSVAIYERLTENRLEKKDRYRVWSSMARAYNKIGRYQDALQALETVDHLVLTNPQEAEAELLKGQAYVGVANLPDAIKVYDDVAGRFPKSKFCAEAHYFLGGIYEEMDSLDTAKKHYDGVTRSYPNSDYAEDAIKKSSNISQLIRLRDTEGAESPEARALRLFSLAEVQLFQFNDPDKALASYNQLLTEFPESEFAPKAAFAVAYIYRDVKKDSVEASEAFAKIIDQFPDSEQAAFARQELGLPPLVKQPEPPPSGPTETVADSLSASNQQGDQSQ
jgi:TolA-binding protein